MVRPDHEESSLEKEARREEEAQLEIKLLHAKSRSRPTPHTVSRIAADYLGSGAAASEIDDVVQEYFDRRGGTLRQSSAQRRRNLNALAKHAAAFREQLLRSDIPTLRDGMSAVMEEVLSRASQLEVDTSRVTGPALPQEQSNPRNALFADLASRVRIAGLGAAHAAKTEQPKEGRPRRPLYLELCIHRLAMIWQRERKTAPVSSRKARLRDSTPSFTHFALQLLVPTDLTGSTRDREETALRSAVREILEETRAR